MNTVNVDRSGAAIVSNTMVCEVSRLFDKPDRRTSFYSMGWRGEFRTAFRLFDLLSLIEALVLHETLYTLPAHLDSDSQALHFRAALLSSGALKELPMGQFHKQIGDLLLAKLAAVKDPVVVAGSGSDIGTPLDISRRVVPKLNEFLLFAEPQVSDGESRSPWGWPGYQRLDGTDGFFAEGGGSSAPLDASSFEQAGRALLGWIEYFRSGAYEHCTSILRDMYYILVSEHLALPYWPQFSRIEFANRFPNYFDKQFRVELYKKLAEAFKTTITEVYDQDSEQVAFIPPFAAIALERSSSPKELLTAILWLRSEHASLREGLAHLEEKRQRARTIKSRKKIRLEQRRLLDDVAAHYASPSRIRMANVARYVPELVKPAVNPLDPSQYSADLLLQPIEWIAKWWRRRPVAMLFDLRDKLESLSEYESLLSKVFGRTIGKDKSVSEILSHVSRY